MRELQREIDQLTQAIASAGQIDALLVAVKERDSELRQAREDLSQEEARRTLLPDQVAAVEKRLLTAVEQWRSTISKRSPEGRRMMQALIEGRLTFMPKVDEKGAHYESRGTGTLDGIISGVLPHKLASPAGFATCWTLTTRDEWTRAA
jgi:hypothetical protein